ncbi:MAG: CHAT domain-containing protein, partial [Kamptonema sp. SIO4C4]|nr:CHAT domain-containing protein [Kamptonema sp. SIO4C4]
PPRAEIEAEVEAFRDFITSQSKDLTQGDKLSQMLLSPIADQLDDQRLIIVGNGKLQLLPFAALPLPNSSETAPLIVNHEIVTLPSFTSLAVQREQWANRPQAQKTLAVFADPVFNPRDSRLGGTVEDTSQDLSDFTNLVRAGCNDPKRLEYTQEEAEMLLAQVPDAQEFKALGFDVNRNTVTSSQLEQYQMVHLATHGCIQDNPLLSSLALSLYSEQGEKLDGLLRLQDIFNLQLNAELVVLSACQTAVGEDVRGEGVIGLTRGFMYAGAERVVVSLWSVNDLATSRLMGDYYQQMLEEELDPLAALREAQLKMWESEQWTAPYYWAAFTLQGEWQ